MSYLTITNFHESRDIIIERSVGEDSITRLVPGPNHYTGITVQNASGSKTANIAVTNEVFSSLIELAKP